ncbi:helix-turn-helix transcriptional regulator [Paenibacillus guangzhouensis]|uniref:helix-turn-helix transcriptional regulator n=1 Tax=Paenibacillus guangzhouensis TaxID=1473112 RepID=UPI0012673B02|nr:YafY family protein [Paenibacillus guangzhouensis]
MKLERLISMIYMLLSHEVVSATALAEKYNVSQRTIYRDIETICAAGIPVVSYQGVNGGYGIIDEYKMDRSLLGSYDVGTLITILNSMSTVFSDDRAQETIHKLQTIQNDQKSPSVTMDISSWPYRETLQLLRTAITEHRVVRFEYVSAKNERVSRVVEPVQLMYKYRTWYIYGYCRLRNDYREFKVTRMDELRMMTEHFKPHQEPTNSDDEQNSQGASDQEQVAVKLHVKVDGLARALDQFYDDERTFLEDGSLLITVRLSDGSGLNWLLPMILSFGDKIRVVEPPEIQLQVKEMLEKMLHSYQEL